MNKIDIWLEDRQLDVADIDLALTYNFSDLLNPTNVTGDYSKTISIKGSNKNNAIFGQIWRFDREILDNENSNIGVHFNASKRVDCKIYINGGLFKSGYVKLNSIKQDKGVISYDITFYSELCSTLHNLNEKKLVDLNFHNNLQHTIDRYTINGFWNNEHTLNDSMTYILANNGMYDDFQNDKMMYYTSSTATKPVIGPVTGEIELDECAKGEYRSYKQRPALKVSEVCRLIADESSLELDNSFFNENNPYFEKTYLTLPLLKKVSSDITEIGKIDNQPFGSFEVESQLTSAGIATSGPIPYQAIPDSSIFLDESQLYLQNMTGISTVTVETQFRGRIKLKGKLPIGAKFWFGTHSGNYYYGYRGDVIANIWLEDSSGNQFKLSSANNYFLSSFLDAHGYIDETDGTYSYGWILWKNPYSTYKGGEHIREFPMRFYNQTPQGWTNGPFTVEYELKYRCYNIEPILYLDGNTTKTTDVVSFLFEKVPIGKVPTSGSYDISDYYPVNDGFTGVDITIFSKNSLNTNVSVDKSVLIDNEIMAGDFLINYTKLFGLLYETTEDGRIIIKSRNKFFQNYKILDWSDKIDYSKTIKQTPIPFEDKYIEFNYENGETYYENYYNRKFDIDYGTAKVNTGYEFNNNSKSLINNKLFRNTICSQEKTKMIVGTKIVFTTDEKVVPALFTLEDNQRNISDTKYNLLFDNGLKELTNHIFITDDSKYMLDESLGVEDAGEPCWINTRSPEITKEVGLERSNYRQFSTLTDDGQYSLDFGYPRENYANLNTSSYPQTSTIYSKFWKNYIDEIYNVNNKVVTCHIKLTPMDMTQFSFKNFVKAFGCLWHVNKINNYNPLKDTTTEVELIKVVDIENYINGQISFPIDVTVTFNVRKERYWFFNSTTNTPVITNEVATETINTGDTYRYTLPIYGVDTTTNTQWRYKTVKVMMGENDITSTVFNPDTQIIEIRNVNDNITINTTVVNDVINPSEDFNDDLL